MLVLRKSNFQCATIRPIVPRKKQCCLITNLELKAIPNSLATCWEERVFPRDFSAKHSCINISNMIICKITYQGHVKLSQRLEEP